MLTVTNKTPLWMHDQVVEMLLVLLGEIDAKTFDGEVQCVVLDEQPFSVATEADPLRVESYGETTRLVLDVTVLAFQELPKRARLVMTARRSEDAQTLRRLYGALVVKVRRRYGC